MYRKAEPETFSNTRKDLMTAESFGVESSSSIQGAVQFVPSSYCISSFFSGLHWPEHRSMLIFASKQNVMSRVY